MPSHESESPAQKLRGILFKSKKPENTLFDLAADVKPGRAAKAKVDTFSKTKSQLQRIVLAQKTALGQVQVSTLLVKEDDDKDQNENGAVRQDVTASKSKMGDGPNEEPRTLNREEKAQRELMKYLVQKRKSRQRRSMPSRTLMNGVPCKLDNRGNAILDPLTQPVKTQSASKNEEIDPTSISQPFFVINGHNGTKLIYREDSIKNLMNNSVVRYDDPAVLENAKK